MSTTWQCWAKRSTSATMQAAPGNTVPHCLNERFNVEEIVMRSSEQLSSGIWSETDPDPLGITVTPPRRTSCLPTCSSPPRAFSHFVKDPVERCSTRSRRCWCEAAMHRSLPADTSISGALRHWADRRGMPVTGRVGPALERFRRHLQRGGRCRHFGHTFRLQILHGARLFLEHLHDVGVIEAPAVEPPVPASPLISGFSQWMRQQRGTCTSTLDLRGSHS